MTKFTNKNRGLSAQAGFIKIALLIIGGLILLKYAYDVDVLERVYEFGLTLWSKYSPLLKRLWD